MCALLVRYLRLPDTHTLLMLGVLPSRCRTFLSPHYSADSSLTGFVLYLHSVKEGDYLNTMDFMDAIVEKLEAKLEKQAE